MRSRLANASLVLLCLACAGPGPGSDPDEGPGSVDPPPAEEGYLVCPAVPGGGQGLRLERGAPAPRAASARTPLPYTAVDGDTLFFLNALRRRLQLVDVSDPASPRLGAEVPASGVGLFFEGDRVVVVGGDDGLTVVDVADRAAPRIVATLEAFGTVAAVERRGARLLVLTVEPRSAEWEYLPASLVSIELGDRPAVLGRLDFDTSTRGARVAFTASGAVVRTARETILRVDVEANGTLVERGTVGLPGRLTDHGLTEVDASTVRAATYTGAGVRVSMLGLDDVEGLVELGASEVAADGAVVEVVSAGPISAVALETASADLVLVDHTDPTAPVVTSLELEGGVRALAVAAGRFVALTVSAGDLGLIVVEPGAPPGPRLSIGSNPAPGGSELDLIPLPRAGLVGVASGVPLERPTLALVAIDGPSPVLLGAVEDVPLEHLVESGSSVFALAATELALLDPQAAGGPARVGSLRLANYNDLLALLDGSTGVVARRDDVSSPSRLAVGPLSTLDLGPVDGELELPLRAPGGRLFVHGDHAYLLVSEDLETAALVAVDLTDRQRPRLGATLRFAAPLDPYGVGLDVAQVGGTLLVHSFRSGLELGAGVDGAQATSDHKLSIVELAGDAPVLVGELAPEHADWVPGLLVVGEDVSVTEQEPADGGCHRVWRRRIEHAADGGPRLGARTSSPGALLAADEAALYGVVPYGREDLHTLGPDAGFTVRARDADGAIELGSEPSGAVATPWGVAVLAGGHDEERPGDMWSRRHDRLVTITTAGGVLAEAASVELEGVGRPVILAAGGGFAVIRSGGSSVLADLRTSTPVLHPFHSAHVRAAAFAPGVVHVLDAGAFFSIPLPP